MSFPRASGILLHPTSLPGRFGIGDLGSEAYRFADFLANAGQRLWQMLPLGPTGPGNSPYQCLSTFAGNPLLISPEKLAEDGLLEPADLKRAPEFPDSHVDYESVTTFRTALLKKSFEIYRKTASQQDQARFNAFCRQHASWLDDYSLFVSLKEAHDSRVWNTWGKDIRTRQPESVARWTQKLAGEIERQKYQQYQLFKQWAELREYCNQNGIKLIGDVPIFVALDSAEVWSHPEYFHLDSKGRPAFVAGVPPDFFSSTGQLWGNPLYRWEAIAGNGYDWWIERLRAARALVDIVRLDHFRGFEKYWEVPAGETTAINGRWVPGPGAAMFEALEKAMGRLPVIAEDLGTITPEVRALRDRFGFPGMRVLQFAFSSPEGDEHRPHNYPRNCVVYTGTHDNNTTIGWFMDDDPGATRRSAEEKEQERRLALRYLGADGREINWDLIRLALMSVADTAIIPLQDVLGLGSEARMNRPGIACGCWRWRFTAAQLTVEARDRLRELTALYGR